MKIKALTFAVGLLAATTTLTSCLNDDPVDIRQNYASSIQSFSVSTMRERNVYKDVAGNDSVAIDTVNHANYPFTINQHTRIIENKDSLPMNTLKDRVLVRIKADTEYIYYIKNGKDTLWTAKDSIDFTNDVTFKVFSTAYNAGMNKFYEGLPYTIKINVHTMDPDSMQWNKAGGSYIQGNGFGTKLSRQKSVYANNTVYTFGEDNGTPCIKYATISNGNMGGWSDFPLNGITGINTYSATVYDGKVYFSTNDKVYFIEGNQLVVSDDATINDFFKGFTPGVRTHSSTQKMKHNQNILRTIILNENMGTEADDTTAIVSTFMPSQGKWNAITFEKHFGCPDFENVSMVSYDKKLIAFGGPYMNKFNAFGIFYSSSDNGLTWKKDDKYMFFPKEFENYYIKYNKNYSTFVDLNPTTGKDNFIWIVWEDGTYSKGRINRLGFKPKEWN